MKKRFEAPLLHRPIAELDISDEFKKSTLQNQFHTLADILDLPQPYDLLACEGFDLRLLMEFTAFLAKNGLGHYLLPV